MGAFLAGICGAGLVVAGIFSMDPPPDYPVGSVVPEQPTWHGQVHGYAPFAVFLSLTALSFVLARRFAQRPECVDGRGTASLPAFSCRPRLP